MENYADECTTDDGEFGAYKATKKKTVQDSYPAFESLLMNGMLAVIDNK